MHMVYHTISCDVLSHLFVPDMCCRGAIKQGGAASWRVYFDGERGASRIIYSLHFENDWLYKTSKINHQLYKEKLVDPVGLPQPRERMKLDEGSK